MQVDEHARKFPDQISARQMQLVALARSLSLNPAILPFDLPTVMLDAEMSADMHDVKRELTGRKMTIISVTGKMGLVRPVADKVILLAKDAIVEQGPPEQIFTIPQHPVTRD